MSEPKASDLDLAKWIEGSTPLDDNLEIAQLSAAPARVKDEAGAEIARKLNGPLTALRLYMNESKNIASSCRRPRRTGLTCSRLWKTRFNKPSTSVP